MINSRNNKMNKPMARFRLVQRPRVRARMMTHQKVLLVTSLFSAIALGFVIFINLYQTNEAYAAVNGDYRSAATGNWNATATWERYNGSSWVAAVATPTSTDGVITIQNGHTVTVTASVTVDQVVVDAGGQITVSTGTLTVNNGAGTDLTANGNVDIVSNITTGGSATFDMAGTVTLRTTGTLSLGGSSVVTILSGGYFKREGGTASTNSGWIINSGGTFEHNIDGGTIPTGTWNSNSTLKLTGITVTNPLGLNQILGNLIYDCPNQTANIDLNDNLNTVNGDFTVVTTGTGSFKFDKSSTNNGLTVGGNYVQQSGTVKMTNNGNWNVSVGGNFTLNNGTFIMAGTSGVPVLTVTGNLIINNGILDMSQYTSNNSSSGIGTINLSGNFTMTGGSLTETATNVGRGDFNFAKTGTQTFSLSGSTITNTINFKVNSGSILDAGNNIFTGDGTFTLASGGSIILSSPDGISSSGATGNVQCTGARSFSTGANYTYNGSSAQITGSGLPSTVNNFTLNNSSGITLTNSVIVSSILTFTSGNITTNANVITLGTTQSNLGTLNRTSGHVIGSIKRWMSSSTVNNILFPVGTATYYEGANLSITSIPSGGTITANFTATGNSFYGLQIADGGEMIGTVAEGYWTLTPADGFSTGGFTLNLYANSLVPIMTNYTKMHIIRKALLGDPWSVNGTHTAGTGSNANPVANRTAANQWGIFAIGSAVGFPLPVELIRFDAKPAGNAVECLWATASEINNDNFTVERSADGKRFVALETIVGAGNSNTTINYSFNDTRPLKGINYYRLKQTDFDGKFTYSPIKSVTLESNLPGTTFAINSVSPNPFRNEFSISYTVADNSTIGISIMNVNGQVVFKEKQNASRGVNRFDYNDNNNLPSGIYFATLSFDKEIQIQKIIKN